MDWITRSDAVQACLLTTVGSLLVFGALPFPHGATLLAVALAVAAVLVLARSVLAPLWLGATFLAIALLILVTNPAGRLLERVLDPNAHVIAGGLLTALGVLRLAARDAWPDGDSGHDTQAVADNGPTADQRAGPAARHGSGAAAVRGADAAAVHAAKPDALRRPEAAAGHQPDPLAGSGATT